MERPRAKIFKIINADIANLEIAHRKKAHDDVFFIATAGIEKKGIRFWMATVVLQKKLPII
jgi:hypothetical protein